MQTTRRDHEIMGWALFLQKEFDSSQCLPFTNCWDLDKLFTSLSLSLISMTRIIISLRGYRGDEINLLNICKELNKVPDTE